MQPQSSVTAKPCLEVEACARKNTSLDGARSQSIERTLQRMLTQSLATLLSELDQVLAENCTAFTDATLSEDASFEALPPPMKGPIAKESSGHRPLPPHNHASTNSPSTSTAQHPAVTQSGAANLVPYLSEVVSDPASGSMATDQPQQKFTLTSIPSRQLTEKEILLRVALKEGLSSPRQETPFSQSTTSGSIPTARTTANNPVPSATAQPSGPTTSYQLARETLSLLSQQGSFVSPSAHVPTGVSPESIRIESQIPNRVVVTAALSRLSEVREILLSLLSEPGALPNELEPTLFKTLLTSLTKNLPLGGFDQNGGSILTDAQDYEQYCNSEKSGEAHNTPTTRANDNPTSSLKGAKRSSDAVLAKDGLTLLQPMTVGGRAVEPSPPPFNPPGGEGHLPFLSTTNSPPRHIFGAFSDPALLVALQAASLKRSYSAHSTRRSRPCRRPSPQAPSKEETLNDTSRESKGLMWLRAYLERRRG